MARIFHPLLLILANATHCELAAQVQYLKTENEILRSKLPTRVTVIDAERRQLVKLGTKVGAIGCGNGFGVEVAPCATPLIWPFPRRLEAISTPSRRHRFAAAAVHRPCFYGESTRRMK